jgi:hypothetical protein
MTDTLFDVVYNAAAALGIVSVDTTATGGSTTTIVDTKRTEADDTWNAGTAFAVDQMDFRRITDYALSGTLITVSPAWGSAIANGDRYALAKKRYPMDTMVQMVNRALQEMGTLLVTDTASVVTVGDQAEYDLPVEVSYDLRQVWVQGDTDNALNNRWVMLHNWEVQQGDIGLGNTLVLSQRWDAGRALKLVYTGKHPNVFAPSDEISESIYLDRVVATTVVNCLNWRYQKTNDATVLQQLNTAKQAQAEANARYPIRLPRRTPKLLIMNNWSGGNHYSDNEI